MFFHEAFGNNTYSGSYETLDTWKSKYGFDGASQTSPIDVPSFTYTNATNINKFSNGYFTQNVNDVSSYSSFNDVSTSWNPNKLDAGTLQVTARNYSPNNNIMLTLPLMSSVTAGKSYLLSFSLQGATGGRLLEAYLRRKDFPNYDLTTRIKVPIAASRKENQLAFVANSTDGASIELDISQANSDMWMDNIILQEAECNIYQPWTTTSSFSTTHRTKTNNILCRMVTITMPLVKSIKTAPI